MTGKAIVLSLATALAICSGTNQGQAPAYGDFIGEYINGVISDSGVLSEEMTANIDKYVKEVLDSVDEVASGNKTGEEFADEMEKKAEDFADELERVGDAYGDMQEFKGNAFGNRFDRHPSKIIKMAKFNIFKGK